MYQEFTDGETCDIDITMIGRFDLRVWQPVIGRVSCRVVWCMHYLSIIVISNINNDDCWRYRTVSISGPWETWRLPLEITIRYHLLPGISINT